MAPLGSDDLAFALEDLGEATVTLGSVTVPCLVNQPDARVAEAEGASHLVARSVVLHIQSGTLPGLASGATITVHRDGTATTYRVREHLAVEDGEFTEIHAVLDA